MGAFGAKSFENDDAMDWLDDFERDGASAVARALATVDDAGPEDYVDALDAGPALAAAEIVAAAQSGDISRLPDEAHAAFATHRAEIDVAELAPLAATATERVLTNSELRELWEDSDDFDEWKADIVELQEQFRNA